MATPFDGVPDAAWSQVQDAWSKGDPWIGSPTSVVARLNRLGIHPTGTQQQWWMSQGAHYSPQQPKGPNQPIAGKETMGQALSGAASYFGGQAKYLGQAALGTIQDIGQPHPGAHPSLGGILAEKFVQPTIQMAKSVAAQTGQVMTPQGAVPIAPPQVRQALQTQGAQQVQGAAGELRQAVQQPYQAGGILGVTKHLLAQPGQAIDIGLMGALGAGALHGAGVPLPKLLPRKAPETTAPETPTTEGAPSTVKFNPPVPVEHTPTGRQGVALSQTGDTVRVAAPNEYLGGRTVVHLVPAAELKPVEAAPQGAQAGAEAGTQAAQQAPSAPAAPAAKTLTPAVQAKVNEINQRYATYRQNVQQSIQSGITLPDDGARELKGLGMRQAAEVRQATGNLTPKEQTYANRPFQKGVTQVQLPNGDQATYQGHAFGNLRVKGPDGTIQTLPPDQVTRLGNTPDEAEAVRQSLRQRLIQAGQEAATRNAARAANAPSLLSDESGSLDPEAIKDHALELAGRVASGKAGDLMDGFEQMVREYGDALRAHVQPILDAATTVLRQGAVERYAAVPSYQPGSIEEAVHTAIREGRDTSADLNAIAQAHGVRNTDVPDFSDYERALRSGFGYRKWYEEYGKRLIGGATLGKWTDSQGREVSLLSPGSPFANEIAANWAITSANASPLKNLRGTFSAMTRVRELMAAGLWDAKDVEGTAQKLKALTDQDNGYITDQKAKQIVQTYNQGQTASGGMKTPTYGLGTLAAGRGDYFPWGVVDLHIRRFGGGPEGAKVLPENFVRLQNAILTSLASKYGISPLEAQAGMWEPARIIGDDLARLKKPLDFKDGTHLPAGSEIAVAGRMKSGTLMVRHPNDLEMTPTGLRDSDIEPIFEGVKSRRDRGVPPSLAVKEALDAATAAGALNPEAIRQRLEMQAKGEFGSTQALAQRLAPWLRQQELAAREAPERAYLGEKYTSGPKKGQPRGTDFPITESAAAKVTQDVTSRSPTVAVSAYPGGGANPDLAAQVHNETMAPFYDPATRTLTFLSERGIRHEVMNPQAHGGWQGAYDPSFRIRFPGGTLDQAEYAAALMGKPLRQDAVAVYDYNAAAKPHVSAFIPLPEGETGNLSQAQYLKYKEAFEGQGLDVVLSHDGKSLEVMNIGGADADPAALAEWENQVGEAAGKAGLAGPVDFVPGQSYLLGDPQHWGEKTYADVLRRGLPDPTGAPERYPAAPRYQPESPDLLARTQRAIAGAQATALQRAYGVPWGPERPGLEPEAGGLGGHGPEDIARGAGSRPFTSPVSEDPVVGAAWDRMVSRAQQLRAHFGSETGALNPGRQPGLFLEGDTLRGFLSDASLLGSHYLKQGLTNFTDWSQALYQDLQGISGGLAEALRPHLAAIWQGALRQAISDPTYTGNRAELKRLFNTPVLVPAWIGLSDQPDVVQSALAHITQDPSGQLALSQAIASSPPQLRTETLSQTAGRARALADQLRMSPEGINKAATEKMSGVEINALMNLVRDNTALIDRESRRLSLPDERLSDTTRQMSSQLIEAAMEQNENLLSRIVEARSQKGRDLSSLRLLAQQSTDPEVWLVQAKQALGDRPLTQAIQNDIYRLANAMKVACG